ncbi:MAG: beta-aspartyl-peptidase [Cryobacterium sp.]|nr:beta-aspartyl-peptidase [Oligoflexia bacterium]
MKKLSIPRLLSPILIEGAEIFSPAPLGVQSVLLVNGKVMAIREKIERDFVLLIAEGMEVEPCFIDARGHRLIPGVVDAHEHLTGGSGEDGFATQTPAITLEELIRGGITTVVGCIGVDTYTQNLPHLLGRVKALREEGISAWMYTGGYDVPPQTLTGDVRTDLILVSEVIGAGETAIADRRSTQPSTGELARIVAAARTGGLLTQKAGITHFHVGDEPRGISQLNELLDHFDVCADCLYPTHVERKPALLKESAKITHRGVVVDMDVCEQDLEGDLSKFVEEDGLLTHLTFSSDASIISPRTLYDQVRGCILNQSLKKKTHSIETLLSLITLNPARVLKMPTKGWIAVGADADVLVVDSKFEIRDVIASGRLVMAGGVVKVTPRYDRWSNRFGSKIER